MLACRRGSKWTEDHTRTARRRSMRILLRRLTRDGKRINRNPGSTEEHPLNLLAFKRLIRQTLFGVAENSSVATVTSGAFLALLEGAEDFLTDVLQKTNQQTVAAGRITIQPKDMRRVCPEP